VSVTAWPQTELFELRWLFSYPFAPWSPVDWKPEYGASRPDSRFLACAKSDHVDRL
jgi:hypothetical protein